MLLTLVRKQENALIFWLKDFILTMQEFFLFGESIHCYSENKTLLERRS